MPAVARKRTRYGGGPSRMVPARLPRVTSGPQGLALLCPQARRVGDGPHSGGYKTPGKLAGQSTGGHAEQTSNTARGTPADNRHLAGRPPVSLYFFDTGPWGLEVPGVPRALGLIGGAGKARSGIRSRERFHLPYQSSCPGLTRASMKQRNGMRGSMDCRVKPGNDEEETLAPKPLAPAHRNRTLSPRLNRNLSSEEPRPRPCVRLGNPLAAGQEPGPGRT